MRDEANGSLSSEQSASQSDAAAMPAQPSDMRRLTGLWRWGINVLPPAQITDFYGWLALLDAAIDERTRRTERRGMRAVSTNERSVG